MWRTVSHPGWKVVTAVIATAASIASVATVVTQVVGEGGAGCPREAAMLRTLGIQEKITLRQFLEATGASTAPYKEHQLRQLVEMVQMGVAVAGYRKRRLTVEWTMLAKGNKAFGNDRLKRQGALEIQPTVCETSAQSIFRTPVPERPAVIEVTLRNGSDVLAITQTRELAPR